MVARLQSNQSAAKKRSQASQQIAGTGATNNQTAKPDANGVLAPAPLQAMRPTVSSEQSDLLKLVRPDNAASLILTAIKVLSEEARTYTGRAPAYGLSHHDFLALSRVVSALSANRTAFGYRPPSTSLRYHPNCY
jgi:hypothetical protein